MQELLIASQPAGNVAGQNSNDKSNSDYLLIHKRHLLLRCFLMSNFSGNGKQYKENIFLSMGIFTIR